MAASVRRSLRLPSLVALLLAGCASPGLVPLRDTVAPSWRTVERAPAVVVDGGSEVLRFDERHEAGSVWNPAIAFRNGDIDVDVRGRDVVQKSFVGIVFRAIDDTTFQVVWLRPFNFRASEAERRSHALQFASYPAFTWQRLRAEHPGLYEAELVPAPDPAAWVHLHLELRERRVKVFVDRATTPALDVEAPDAARAGGVGLWVGSDSNGDFRGFRVVPRD